MKYGRYFVYLILIWNVLEKKGMIKIWGQILIYCYVPITQHSTWHIESNP